MLDLVAREFPLETIVARALLEMTNNAATLPQLIEMTGLSGSDVSGALERWVIAGGVRELRTADGRYGPVFWMQPLVRLKELCRQHRWISKWATSQPKRQRNTLLQIRRRLQPRGELKGRCVRPFLGSIVARDS